MSLQTYSFLNEDCANRGIRRFPLKPKLHLWNHLLRDAIKYKENPTWSWCFSDEDMIGRVKTMAQHCHPWTMTFRVLKRWSQGFFAQYRCTVPAA